MTEYSLCPLIRGCSSSWSTLSQHKLDELAIDTCDDLKLALFAILTSAGAKSREEDRTSMSNIDHGEQQLAMDVKPGEQQVSWCCKKRMSNHARISTL
jgi:hypothetical protein